MSLELQYLLLFTIVLVLPKMLLRFGVPAGISAFILGIITINLLGWFKDDQVVMVFSRLGITSLFLFAGLEINLQEIKKETFSLCLYLLQSVIVIVAVAYLFHFGMQLAFRPAMILALGIMTPSTGFILNSLKSYNLTEEENKWIRLKAISNEIVAILLLFFVLQSSSWNELLLSNAYLLIMILMLPLIFKLFLKFIAPYAPDSELPFLILIAFLSGIFTMKIGAYYLVGAFIAGLTAGQFKTLISSMGEHNIIPGLTTFFGFFIPFYFFSSGLSIARDFLSLEGAFLGALFIIIFIPIRYFSTFLSIRFFVKNFWGDRRSITLSLIPTLIFGLVIVSILRDRFQVDPVLLSGLVVYTIATSITPALLFRKSNTLSKS